ncbi:MAG: tetraacyldisaccharide 4'-kinase [Acidobacteriaceae bacterium]
MRMQQLLPLSALYQLVVAVKNQAYAHGWAKPATLQWPVISIGNLSVGGAGKTPFTIYLAQLLTTAGFRVDVLSRGYGRSGGGVARVDPAGSAADFGDEPVLIAREAHVPVFVGASRHTAGLLAERTLAADTRPHVHLLDDGLQHRKLARDLDIVLVHRSDLTAKMLPAGRLREPLAALGRAHAVVLREEDADLEPWVRRYLRPGAHLWSMQRSLDLAWPVSRAVSFCAIAHPADFAAGLRAHGITLADSFAWRDHHRYALADMRALAAAARKSNAEAFITTAKDAIKLDRRLLEELGRSAPLVVATLAVRLRDEQAFLEQISGLLSARYSTEPEPSQPGQ